MQALVADCNARLCIIELGCPSMAPELEFYLNSVDRKEQVRFY